MFGANIAQLSEQTIFSCKYLSDFTIFVKYSESVSPLLIVIDLMQRLMGFVTYYVFSVGILAVMEYFCCKFRDCHG